MTNTDLVAKYSGFVFDLLRRVRDESGPSGVSVNVEFYIRALDALAGDFVGADLVIELRDRGLLQHGRTGGGWTTSAQADRLLDAVDGAGAGMLAEFESCPYTHSHTSAWCGRPYCRQS